MRRTKRVEIGLHRFLLIEESVSSTETRYHIELAGRGGLALTFDDLKKLSKEAKTFERKNAD